MATPEDARPRDTDDDPMRVLRRELGRAQAAYDELLGDFLAAKNAYYLQRDGLRKMIADLNAAIDVLERERDKEGME